MSINRSKDFIREIKRNGDDFYIIHYSCQSLYDDNESLSPRITSIAVVHYSTDQAISYSTHAIAEEMGVARDDVVSKFDDIEKKLLDDFYAFVRDRQGKYWVHWNMRNLTYGFEHIQHRYRVLNQKDAPVIGVGRRINLNDILVDRYGDGYAKHPNMLSLMEMNGGRHRDFLEGKEEVSAFQEKEYIKMHNSTLCKVGFFHIVIQKLIKGKLRTAARGIGVILDRIFESRFAKAASLVSATVTIIVIILGIARAV